MTERDGRVQAASPSRSQAFEGTSAAAVLFVAEFAGPG